MSILSIQSHVSFGHAGNSAGVFPLQFLGFNIWPVYTVNYSNHTGYGKWQGQINSAEHIKSVVKGIFEVTPVSSCEALLTGYLGSDEIAKSIQEIVQNLKKANPNILYCCDPVMGDVGRGFFVKEGIPEFFKNNIVPMADIITPNHFEFNVLCGESTTYAKAISNAQAVISKGVKWVIVKSFIGEETLEGTLDILAISKNKTYKITTPYLTYKNLKPPVGTGDLFTALFLGNYLKTKGEVAKALETATESMFGILKVTRENNKYELEIVKAREEITGPSNRFKATLL